MLKRRVEFIGLQNGETVSGHIYARNWDEVTDYLNSENVEKALMGYAGFVPENFILPHSIAMLIVNKFGRDAGQMLKETNDWFLGLLEKTVNEDF
jgi:hypothetical protein